MRTEKCVKVMFTREVKKEGALNEKEGATKFEERSVQKGNFVSTTDFSISWLCENSFLICGEVRLFRPQFIDPCENPAPWIPLCLFFLNMVRRLVDWLYWFYWFYCTGAGRRGLVVTLDREGRQGG